MARVRTEIEIDAELLRWAEERAQRDGRDRDDVLEDAVRSSRSGAEPDSPLDIASAVWQHSDLTEDEAMAIASAEVTAYRAERRAMQPRQ